MGPLPYTYERKTPSYFYCTDQLLLHASSFEKPCGFDASPVVAARQGQRLVQILGLCEMVVVPVLYWTTKPPAHTWVTWFTLLSSLLHKQQSNYTSNKQTPINNNVPPHSANTAPSAME
jgi:hypothetical protein